VVRYLLDEDLSPRVAEIARAAGLDVESVHEIDRRGFSDELQLEYAASRQRTMVTRNRDDFIRLTVDSFRAGTPHWGVLIVPRSLPNRQPERLARSLERWQRDFAGDDESLRYLIDFLPTHERDPSHEDV
jgi:predicted nuclease of predicted toxin-antitoxin system